MKRFFRVLLQFSLYLGVAVVLLCIVVRTFLHVTFRDAVAKYPIASTLILGDSHTEIALLADSLKSAFNFSAAGESLTKNYTKLRILSEDTPNTHRLIILGVAHHSFCTKDSTPDAAFDYEFWFSLYPFLYGESRRIYQAEVPSRTLTEIKVCHELGFPARNSIPALRSVLQGHFRPAFPGEAKAAIPINWKESIDAHFNGAFPSQSNIDGLRNIRDLCLCKGYTLMLFSAPVPSGYYANIPPLFKQLTDSIIRSLIDNQTVFYLDYARHPLPDSCFYDGDHVNIYGARLLTPLLRDTLSTIIHFPLTRSGGKVLRRSGW